MSNNLFIEGEIGIGKSTFLRTLLLNTKFSNEMGSPNRQKESLAVAGFSVQRIIFKSENKVAYRLMGAFEIQPVIYCESMEKMGNIENVFLQRELASSKKSINDLSVFDNYGTQLLEIAEERAEIIFLDEIGGIDMAAAKFSEKVASLIESSIPCIGVIKQRKKAGKYLEENIAIRAIIEKEENSEIVQFR
ncbi:MAG: nucleoside-triphosphatase [Anaerovoracaceae bacterium]